MDFIHYIGHVLGDSTVEFFAFETQKYVLCTKINTLL